MEFHVEVRRGELVESQHIVVVHAADARGRSILPYDRALPLTYLRSAAKPVIAAAVVRAGAVERFGLEQREIAIIAGSHLGTPMHVAAVDSILAKIGLGRSALRCGITSPGDEEAARNVLRSGSSFEAIHNNCSGKHAGILALSLMLDPHVENWESLDYRQLEHPAQQAITGMYERVFGMPREKMVFGIDGCGIPAVALPLDTIASGFARFVRPENLEKLDCDAVTRVCDAMISYPEYVRGEGGFDTLVMRGASGNLMAKSGAEGVFVLANLPDGYGLALKVLDGSNRAVPPSICACLDFLGTRGFEQATPILSVSGRPVGEIRAILGKIPNVLL